jgi:hypothetical protein
MVFKMCVLQTCHEIASLAKPNISHKQGWKISTPQLQQKWRCTIHATQIFNFINVNMKLNIYDNKNAKIDVNNMAFHHIWVTCILSNQHNC